MRILSKYLRAKRLTSGQSFVELALTLPVVLLLLAGLVEVGFVMFTYLTMLDQTREAARFASVRNYRDGMTTVYADPPGACPKDKTDYPTADYCNACRDGNRLDYFYDTSCFFIDPDLNPYITFQTGNWDDVAISVFTVTNNQVTNRWPNGDDTVWSLNNDNWTKNCKGVEINPSHTPFMTDADIQSLFVDDAPSERGLVLVEGYYCYDLLLDLPIISQIVPSPFRIHAYTIMPNSDALPTPTPIPPHAP